MKQGGQHCVMSCSATAASASVFSMTKKMMMRSLSRQSLNNVIHHHHHRHIVYRSARFSPSIVDPFSYHQCNCFSSSSHYRSAAQHRCAVSDTTDVVSSSSSSSSSSPLSSRNMALHSLSLRQSSSVSFMAMRTRRERMGLTHCKTLRRDSTVSSSNNNRSLRQKGKHIKAHKPRNRLLLLQASVSSSPSYSTASQESKENDDDPHMTTGDTHEQQSTQERTDKKNADKDIDMKWPRRSHYCSHVSSDDIVDATQRQNDNDGDKHGGDYNIHLCGWVDATRVHGNGVVFIDMRDSSGIVQVVGDPQIDAVAAEKLEKVRQEYCINVEGMVRLRQQANPKLKNGNIEVVAQSVTVLNKVEKPLPFAISSTNTASGSTKGKEKVQAPKEETRLRHRVMDLRSVRMANNLKLRHSVIMSIRRFLEKENFLEIETPMLTASTPEGARDYLVPSRVEKGRFFALPQSPQVFKQLLMCGGVDRYYQIARCFRDEDLRADRQPEFTQLDIEMAFMDQKSIMSLSESMIRTVFQEAAGISLPDTIPVMTYDDAISAYGSDKPDLRFGMPLVDVSSTMLASGFKVFSDIVHGGGVVTCIKVSSSDNASTISNSRLKNSGDIAKEAMKGGVRGIAYLRVNEGNSVDGVKPLKEGLNESQTGQLLTSMGANEGDLLIFAAGPRMIANTSLGRVRSFLGQALGKIAEDAVAPVWVVDWPLFEIDEEGQSTSLHHPFTAPQGDASISEEQLLTAKAMAYDFVYNGIELGGGSLRIHKKELQQKVFKVLGLDASEAEQKFGALLEALSMGAPPHGGIAFGMDRMTAVLAGEQSIRDVIAFPKTTQAQCLLMQAPSEVSEEQKNDLGL